MNTNAPNTMAMQRGSSVSSSKIILSPKTSQEKTNRPRFPSKLHQLLDDAENENNEHIVGWSPNGLSFIVHKPKEFATTIMPRYFRHSNFRSFQRQVSSKPT